MTFRTMFKFRRVYFPREAQEFLERRVAVKGPEFCGRYWAMKAMREATKRRRRRDE